MRGKKELALFAVPYRWLPRTTLSNLGALAHRLTRGIRNLVSWFRLAWCDRPWDYAFLLRAVEFKLEAMARAMEYSWHVGADREIRRMRVCSALCRRIIEDDYGAFDGKEFQTYFKGSKTCFQGAKRDAEYLGHLLGRHILKWWT